LIALAPFLTLEVQVDPVIDLGAFGTARRRMVPITGGTVCGAHSGTVLPGGADWQEVRPDGSLDIAARYVLNLQEGLVEVDSRGLRHATPEVLARLERGEDVDRADYYFRTAIRLRSSAAALSHLNNLLLVSVGERRARKVHLDVYRVT
jgi:hypothetical protein